MQPGDRIGPYRILRLLNTGGMGVVYEALHEAIERRVALKVLNSGFANDRDAVERFFNEARATNRVEHPSIVQVSDYGHTPDGTAYLVMEFLRGESLGRRLQALHSRSKLMPLVSALQTAWQIADALAAAHEKGIVHRDLKPDNLMVVPEPIAPGGERVKILDFGIAKLTGNDGNVAKTRAQVVMGTPHYMSPEQCRGASGVDEKTDVYALGIILFLMLAGRLPFIAKGDGELLALHMYQEPPDLLSLAPHVPMDVATLVQRLLQKDRTLRPSMQQAAGVLARLLATSSGSGPVVPPERTSVQIDLNATRMNTAAPVHWLDEKDLFPGLDSNATRMNVLPQAPTSFGQSTGQRFEPASGQTMRQLRSPGRWLGGVIVLGIPTLLIGTLSLCSRTANRPSPTGRTRTLSASSLMGDSKRVRWTITSAPSGAEIFDPSGVRLGVTPFEMDALPPRTGAPFFKLRISKDGYQESTLQLDPTSTERRNVVLVLKTKSESISTP